MNVGSPQTLEFDEITALVPFATATGFITNYHRPRYAPPLVSVRNGGRRVTFREPMSRYEKRQQIIAYVAPYVSLFPTKVALVFGTRHGVPHFAEEILSLYRQGYFTNMIISGGVTGRRCFARRCGER